MNLEDMEVIILGIIGSQSGDGSLGGIGDDSDDSDGDGICLPGIGFHSDDNIGGGSIHTAGGDSGISATALEERAIAAFHELNPDMTADEDGMPVIAPVDAAKLEATKAAFTTALAHLIESDSVAETTTDTGETAFRLN